MDDTKKTSPSAPDATAATGPSARGTSHDTRANDGGGLERGLKEWT